MALPPACDGESSGPADRPERGGRRILSLSRAGPDFVSPAPPRATLGHRHAPTEVLAREPPSRLKLELIPVSGSASAHPGGVPTARRGDRSGWIANRPEIREVAVPIPNRCLLVRPQARRGWKGFAARLTWPTGQWTRQLAADSGRHRPKPGYRDGHYVRRAAIHVGR
jgi:hypothetical protein